MFSTAQQIINDSGRHPHSAHFNDPKHVTIIPTGFRKDDPFNTYEVSVSFEEFYYHISVNSDQAAFRLRDTIRRGYGNNPKPVDMAKEGLESNGWDPDIELQHDFRISAINYGLAQDLPETGSQNAVLAGLELSELCLNYLIVTRMSQRNLVNAVRRNVNINFNSDPWEMDPSERDRQTIGHRQLENWLMGELESNSIQPLDPGYGDDSIQFDLAWERPNGDLVVCEVKTTANNEVKQIRLGVGQVLHYALQLEKPGRKILPCLLIQSIPQDKSLIQLAEKNGVQIFSPEGDGIPRDLVVG